MGDGRAFHTPDNISDVGARLIVAPTSLFPFLGEVLSYLVEAGNWLAVGATVDDTTEAAWDILQTFYEDNPMIGKIDAFFADPGDMYLALDGATHSEDDYPELYLALPDSMVDDMAGEFTLPDLEGQFLKGQESAEAAGDIGGSSTVALAVDEMPAHDHSYVPPVLNIDLEGPGVPDLLAAGVGAPTTTGQTGSGNAHENKPPFIVVFWYIFSGRTRV